MNRRGTTASGQRRNIRVASEDKSQAESHDFEQKPGVYEVSAEMKAPTERTTSYSFGTSRDRMVKLHIDRIRSQSINNPVPAPGHAATFSETMENSGISFTMGKKIDAFQMRLNRLRQAPGPGQYNGGADLIGNDALASTMQRPATVKFNTARDRFRAPKPQAPPVGRYSAMDNFGQDISARYTAPRKCVFGSEAGAGSILDGKYGLKTAREIPGPGSYATFSEFDL